MLHGASEDADGDVMIIDDDSKNDKDESSESDKDLMNDEEYDNDGSDDSDIDEENEDGKDPETPRRWRDKRSSSSSSGAGRAFGVDRIKAEEVLRRPSRPLYALEKVLLQKCIDVAAFGAPRSNASKGAGASLPDSSSSLSASSSSSSSSMNGLSDEGCPRGNSSETLAYPPNQYRRVHCHQ